MLSMLLKGFGGKGKTTVLYVDEGVFHGLFSGNTKIIEHASVGTDDNRQLNSIVDIIYDCAYGFFQSHGKVVEDVLARPVLVSDDDTGIGVDIPHEHSHLS